MYFYLNITDISQRNSICFHLLVFPFFEFTLLKGKVIFLRKWLKRTEILLWLLKQSNLILKIKNLVTLLYKKKSRYPVGLHQHLALREQSNMFSYLYSSSHLNSKQVTVTYQVSSRLPIFSSIRDRGGGTFITVETTFASKWHCWKIKNSAGWP